ncbi:MAG TPA: OmpA family protein [Acetobacteraceae bacterium]|jgi:outer membrane protein OmpA-like peptidoglycan-associated protein|nr:OmpA family protein [Acetobacteraceae bacterium]
MSARTTLAAALLLGAGLLAPAFAQTQSTPGADAIVKSLTPTDGLNPSTRGIRIGNAPSGQTAPAGAPTQAAAKTPSVSLNIQFATGSADLTPQAIRSLDQLGQALSTPTLAAYHFRIEGHTDTVGSPDQNKSLSERRAEAVVGYLTSKYQIDASRLQAIGMGEDGLAVSTPANTPEARNRRVLVVNVGS